MRKTALRWPPNQEGNSRRAQIPTIAKPTTEKCISGGESVQKEIFFGHKINNHHAHVKKIVESKQKMQF